MRSLPWLACGLLVAWLVAASGCSKSAQDGPGPVPVPTPAEAESQLQQAFGNAPVEVKNPAAAASPALRGADYEKAVQSLLAMKARKDLTTQQYMAAHEFEVAMVERIATAMQAGDTGAKRAYEAYQKSKR